MSKNHQSGWNHRNFSQPPLAEVKRYEDKAGRPFGEPPANEEHPFKVYVQLKGETPKSNALSYATVEDAVAGGNELLSRWWVPIGFEVRNELTGEVVWS